MFQPETAKDIVPENKTSHPLDPLTSEEIKAAVEIIEKSRDKLNMAFIYHYIALSEPPKSLLLPFFLVDSMASMELHPRKVFLCLSDKGSGAVFEAVVNLRTNERESFVQIYNVRAPLSPEDWLNSDIDIIRADEKVKQRCAAVGFPDTDLVTAGPWDMSFVADRTEYMGRRLVQYFLYGKKFPSDNHYAHPLDFVVVFDLDSRTVFAIEDLPTHDDFSQENSGNSAPKGERNYDPELRGGVEFLRKDDKPITTDSPEGVSFTIKGNEVQWQKWTMRVGYNGREGLVLYTISYNDNGKKKPIIYRASLAESFTTYGDPRPPFHRKAAFDSGQFGTGYNLDSQTLDLDALGAVSFMDVVLHNASGYPVVHKNAISIREEDAGILWKHVDYRTGKGSIARSHRLVFSTIATFGNYEYIFNWMFYQDGSIQCATQMTGLISTNMMTAGARPTRWAKYSILSLFLPKLWIFRGCYTHKKAEIYMENTTILQNYGTIVAPQVNAQYHQHFFTARLDVDVAGNTNSVSVVDIEPVPDETGSPNNRYGQGYQVNHKLLRTPTDARTKLSPATGRLWMVTNPTKLHEFTNKPIGWKLMPANSPPLLMHEDSPTRRTAAYLNYDVWVTTYQDDQLFPGGFYLNESGLPAWVANTPTASIENVDVVIWHNFGLTHIPRVEDFPILSTESTGFWFKPCNFFLENPALDVPPPGLVLSSTP
ncbi:Copper amine oxidase 1 [Folsomia candida]|uniref:Amine oxidase n=1 Tax=Folsomia candida TaxID=158441 RepID=A0A226DP91_FOLCA|nr:Copper amine oxidase 1 [Folsomia candida]